MPADQSDVTLRDYGRVLAARKSIVIVAVLLAVGGAILGSALQTPIYASKSLVLVQPREQSALFDSTGATVNERAIRTEIQVIEGEAVRVRVQENLGLEEEPPKVKATAVERTDVISLTVEDANAANAQTYANAYADAYVEIRREQSVAELLNATTLVQSEIDELQAEVDELSTFDPQREALLNQLVSFRTRLDQIQVDAALRTGGATVIKSAELPEEPVRPTPARSAVLAGAIGLIIGVGAVFLVEYLDDKVRDEHDVAAVTDLPVMAIVPVDEPPDLRPIAVSAPRHASVEAYRGLRTNIQFLALDRELRVIQVTSSLPGEGKTTTASNLAVVLAQAGNRVALIDADLRRPRIHEMFGLGPEPGLTDLLLGGAAREVVDHVPIPDGERMSVYTCGPVPSNPSEMLGGNRMRRLLDEMGDHYDFVIVDSAPVLPLADSVALAGAVDAALVVVESGVVTDTELTQCLARLERVSAPVLGVVINEARLDGVSPYTNNGYTGTVAPAPVGTPESVAADA